MNQLNAITQANNESLELEFIEAIHAGFPSPAADHVGERIDIVRELNPHPETTFYARIVGDSMRDAGLFDGDIAVIDRSLEARNGDYVAAFINGEYTLKEYRLDPSGTFATLIPHNSEFQPIKVTADDSFMIWGVISHIVRRIRK